VSTSILFAHIIHYDVCVPNCEWGVWQEDEDVLAEKARLERGDYADSCSLVMRNMKKRFGKRKIAVKGVSLAIEVNDVTIDGTALHPALPSRAYLVSLCVCAMACWPLRLS
jgi:hypothetical protein